MTIWLKVDGVERWVNTDRVSRTRVAQAGVFGGKRWFVSLLVDGAECEWGRYRHGVCMTEDEARVIASLIRRLPMYEAKHMAIRRINELRLSEGAAASFKGALE